ncbi:MAG: C25 family cysteine peptidase [bacterium]
MPVYGLRVLLPQGESVAGVRAVAASEEAIRLDLPAALARAELPTDRLPAGAAGTPGTPGRPDQITAVEPAFDLESAFPHERAGLVYVGTYRGFNVAFINVYPVTYLGASRTLLYAPAVTVTIETRPSQVMLHRSFATLRQTNARDLAAVGALVDDEQARASYVAPGLVRVGAGLADSAETFPYVIVTSSTLEPEFEALRQHRTDRGLRARIVLVSDIAATYSGSDLQTKIREFIKDAYLNWETEYVLLAGDDDIIPHRGLYAVGPSAVDADIASDLYYAGLDGNWNDDGDGYWGEAAEADLMPEVSVGRAAVGDSIEAANFINKVIRYEDSPVAGQTQTALLLGEALSAGTWGGDYKDEIRYGAATHGYTTAGLEGSYSVSTLYDRDLQPAQWTKADLIPLLNSGRHLVNHLGHSSVTYGLRMTNADVETSFTNDGTTSTYFIVYSQGCYSGSFDNRSPSGYTDDCIGEHFTFIANGAAAFVGNSRYGW